MSGTGTIDTSLVEHRGDDEGTEQHPEEGRRRGFVRRNAWVLVVAVLLVVASVVTVALSISRSSTLGAQEARVAELEAQLSAEQRGTASRVNTETMEALGIDPGRVDEDVAIIEALVETAFTWDSGQVYEEARGELIETYGLSEDEPFLTDFMPPTQYNEDEAGQRYYYLDVEGLNSAVSDDLQAEVLSVRADDYTYAVIATIDVTVDAVDRGNQDPQSVTANRKMLLFVTVDAQGDLSNLSGIPASGSTRTSD